MVAHRHGQRLLLADEHDQLLAPRDPGIDQFALQEQVVLCMASGMTTAGNSEPCDLWIVIA